MILQPSTGQIIEQPPAILQNQYTGYARLSDVVAGNSFFPQAGTLPPVNTYQVTPAVTPAPDTGPSAASLMSLAALALGVWVLTRKGRR